MWGSMEENELEEVKRNKKIGGFNLNTLGQEYVKAQNSSCWVEMPFLLLVLMLLISELVLVPGCHWGYQFRDFLFNACCVQHCLFSDETFLRIKIKCGLSFFLWTQLLYGMALHQNN